MNFDYLIEAPHPPQHHRPYTIREMIFNHLAGRSEHSIVLKGHKEEQLVSISLGELRTLIIALSPHFQKKGWKKGDTILLASFQCSNELEHALLFCALACHGIRVFLPIFPESHETESWLQATGFSAVIVPYRETQISKGHLREKETIHALEHFCKQQELKLWDSQYDFGIDFLLDEIKTGKGFDITDYFLDQQPQLHEEAVVFTTSGSQGVSKLIVYTQKSFSLSCISWQSAGLLEPEMMGNACFTVLFCHTIGIRSLMNAIWTGQPLCLVVAEWLLTKPEVARYLLLQMKPIHLVGGPAFYNLLLEFFRQFPELKTGLKKSLKTLVSIGSPYDNTTARQVESALGLPLMNAFGSTETQMISLNKQLKKIESQRSSLGFLLPGVSVGLIKTDEEDVFELHVKSAFGSLRTIGERRLSSFVDTGDLVRKTNDELHFIKRKGTDWIKDDFGVKIPLECLKKYYPSLHKIARHVEWIPLQNMPGLGALIFLHANFKELDPNEIKEWILKRNMEIKNELEPFEYEHRHLERFVLETGEIPLTRKGSISKSQMYLSYENNIRKIKNVFSNDGTCHQVQLQDGSELQQYADPKLAKLLQTLGIDVSFHKGEKDYLYYMKKGHTVEVLDLVGGFGANLLGHHHPVLKNTLIQFIESSQPALNTQGSQYHYPSLLSKELSLLFQEATGNQFKCMLGNTGAEVVEMALHHAYYDWWQQLEKMRDEQLRQFGSNENLDVLAIWDYNLSKAASAIPAIVVINNCFHGNSSGARSLLNHKKHRSKFGGLLKPVPLHVNDRDENWKEDLQKKKEHHFVVFKIIAREAGQDIVKEVKHSTVIASMAEPVRGEGGIRKAHTKLLDYLSQQEYPLIADEIQCGLGRTGNLPAYSKAKYYLLGKSLGGGYEKITALLIEKSNFREDFPVYYNSTFAHGEMAACMALTTLNIIAEEQLVLKSQELGKIFKSKLMNLAAKYSDIIEAVEGEGLMLSVYFSHLPGTGNIVLRTLLQHELLGYLISGWLFHNKQIRILPTLSRPDALRIEPSAYFTENQMNRVCSALEEVCRLIRIESIYELTRYLMNDDPYLDRRPATKNLGFPKQLEEAGMDSVKVGFIANFTAPVEELRMIEPDFQLASDTGLRILFDKLQMLLQGKPIHLFSKNLMDGRVNFSFYILPFDTSHLEAVNRWGNKKIYISRIQDAVISLAAKQCRHISLGAYCSIITGNGLQLASPHNCLIHTGNTLTVSSILYHVSSYLEREECRGRKLTIAITGANGNIGGALATSIAELQTRHSLLLIGNNPRKLENLSQSLRKSHPRVAWSQDLYSLRKADIILCCTNSNDPLVFPHHIREDGKVFLIDVSVPGSVDASVKIMHQVEWCNDASSVNLPSDPNLLISTHTPVGKIFCCAAEVMLAGIHHLNIPMKGHLSSRPIKLMTELALQEGLFEKLTYANPI